MTEQLLGDAAEAREALLMQLIARARAGESAAFEQLMICSQRRVAATAWRLLGNEEDARDATQEVFLRVYKYLGSFQTEQNFHGWLYRITVNVCRDVARKRPSAGGQLASLETERERGTLAERIAPDDTEASALRDERRAIIGRALETLSERERTALVLRDLEGLSTEEAARILGTRPATVRSQLCLARAKVKAYCDRLLRGKEQE
jgi:RNA polymerase sigma-70 factor (ECF subfamily)